MSQPPQPVVAGAVLQAVAGMLASQPFNGWALFCHATASNSGRNTAQAIQPPLR